MPWYDAFRRRSVVEPSPLPAAEPDALTAAAAPPRGPETQFLRKTERWQNEVWRFHDTVGEFNFGIWWQSNMLSRVRLRAARLQPDQDEPEIVTSGPAADLMMRLGGGVGGQAQLLKRLAVQLALPGEGYLIGETVGKAEQWQVRSVDEIRVQSGQYQVMDEDSVNIGQDWRPLAADHHVIRVWRPHDRYYHLADSPSRSARETLHELELVNRRITADYLSRLASAGVLAIPDEITFPVREEFQDEPNPLMAEWVEIAATAIKNPGTASAVVPIPLVGPAEAIDKIRHIDFTLKIDDKIIERRDSAIRRLSMKLDIPAEILLGVGKSNHWCTLDSVRIMTRGGWKTHDQLTEGEDVLTLNHETGLAEWQPLLKVNRWDVTNETMVTITGRRHSSTTTLNHRWPVLSGEARRGRDRAWTTTAELMQGAKAAGDDAQRHEYMVLAAPNSDLPAEPKYADALVELVAWYYTEGDLGVRPGRNTPQVSITQSREVNPENCARIRRALTALFGQVSEKFDKGGRYASPESVARREEARRLRAENPRMTAVEIGRRLGVSGTMASKYLKDDARLRDNVPKWRERHDGRGITRFVLNAAAAEVVTEHAPGRVVRTDFVQQLTAAQLELFIATSVLGDGHDQRGTLTFGQKDPRMCDAFELACILSGRSVNRYEHTSEGRSANGSRMKTQYMVTASHRSLTFSPRGRSFEESKHTGTIWCPTTPNGTWLAEDNGHVFFTGNSAWAVDEGALKAHIAPLAELVCDALTRGYLQPRLEASGEDPEAWVVWYDMSELALRPDKSANAVLAYDRQELSGAAMLREMGFDEDDSPTPDELEQIGLKWLLRTVPNAAPAALDKLVGRKVLDEEAAAPPGSGGGGSPPGQGGEQTGPPKTRDNPPPDGNAPKTPPNQAAAEARTQRLMQQARTQHMLRVGAAGRWNLLHPGLCGDHEYSCPFTHAVATAAPSVRPGSSGTYLCHLDTFGRLVIDGRSPYADTTAMISTSLVPRAVNGHAPAH